MKRTHRPGDSTELHPKVVELARVARRSLGQMSPAQHQRGREELRDRRRYARRRLIAGLAVLGAASGIAGLFAPRLLHRVAQIDAPLTFHLDDGALDANGGIQAGANAEPALRFVDGSVITLAPGTSGRLASVDARGARLSIRDGAATVSIVPKPHARWLVDVGPFLVTVHGTVFTASWDDTHQRLDVRLERGLVSVTGPITSGPIAVATGQHLTVTLQHPRVVLRDLDDVGELEETAGPEALLSAPATAPPPVVAPPAPARAPRPARVPGRSWTAALAAGNFDAILGEAERDLDRALTTRGTDELAALADAARYRHHDDIARRALLAQRRRFPASPRAADAAFFLGRLEENEDGPRRAIPWYDRYLQESPEGPYVDEALGRKMMAVRELSGEGAARDLAAEYIRRFAHGSYAGAAQALRRDR